MAEAESTIFQPKRTQEAQPRLLPSFLYKTVFFVAIIAIIPFFPSQAPESLNQSILSNGWELLQLLLVGVAISYGLFSRRNADHPEPDKDRDLPPPPKTDTPQSFVFGLLQVPSVFDDDEAESSDTPSGVSDNKKMQSWSHRYHRGDPVVVVADGGGSNAGENGKPLCLPVRSLKSHPQGSEFLDSCNEIDGLVSDDMDDISRRGSFRDSYGIVCADEAMEGVVLPSPIPWRSRSGRFKVKNSPFAGIDVMDAESAPGRTPSIRSLGSASMAKLPPLRSQSSELRDKGSEDSVKKKSFSKVSPPPPPPPPPPIIHGSPYLSDRKDTMSRRSRSSLPTNAAGMNPLRPGSLSESSSSTVRSVPTVRWKDTEGPVMEKTTETAINHPLQEFGRAIHQPPPPPLSPNYEKNGELEKVIVESDDSENDSDAEDVASAAVEAGADENEVDKKADEFIAKFREQIRLQRIESIKRSTGQRSVRNSK